MKKVKHSVDYSGILGEIKTAAHDGKPAKLAAQLADLIKKDTAFADVKGSVAVSAFIRGVMLSGIPESGKVSLASDCVAYTYYANIRRLTKLALIGKAKKAKAAKLAGADRMIASINRMKDADDLEKIAKAITARIAALKA